jgi:sulfur-oxidizing protein SoxY
MKRRAFLALAAAALASEVRADAREMQDALRKLTGGKPLNPGRVTLELPPLSENGHVVPMRVAVASPMTEADHVRAIHVLTEKNPQPNVASFRFGPRAGRAVVQTRIRLADTQTVTAIAEMSDGSFWSASAHVIVTLAACLEELPSS